MKAAQARAIAAATDRVGLLVKDVYSLVSLLSKQGYFSVSYLFYSNTPQDIVDTVIKKLTDDGYECSPKFDDNLSPKNWYNIKW